MKTIAFETLKLIQLIVLHADRENALRKTCALKGFQCFPTDEKGELIN